MAISLGGRFDRLLLSLTLAGLYQASLASTAQAQQAERPWMRLFSSRPTDKGTPTPVKTQATDPRRLLEIQVEIAWLADPTTFPYYLEARVAPQSLEVRGYVPNKMVRDHALNLARVYSSVPVVDNMKEHASLLVKPNLMSPQQLQNSVVSSLREALPKSSSQLKVLCGKDGRVAVNGTVASYEEMVLVSQSLRRLHGCTSVLNQTQVPQQIAAASGKSLNPVPNNKATSPLPVVTTAGVPTNPKSNEQAKPVVFDPPVTAKVQKSPVQTTANVKSTISKLPQETVNGLELPMVQLPFSNQLNPQEGPSLDLPIEETSQPKIAETPATPEPGVQTPATVVEPTPQAPATPLTPEIVLRVKRKIQETCQGVKDVRVEAKGNELKIEVTTRTVEQVETFGTRIFSIPEVITYRGDLQFKIEP